MPKKNQRQKQVLSPTDELVRALLLTIQPIIIDWSLERGYYLIADLVYESDAEEAPFDQDTWLAYEVSDGVPGERTTCTTFYTYEEAAKEFQAAIDRVCITAPVRR